MRFSAKSGLAIAATAAAMLMNGALTIPASAGEADKVHCFGVNSCKGTGACKTASNACKGQNACKGHGFVELTAAECKEKGGSTTEKKS